ncbi:c-type cytochrome [Jiella mangrovi]|uniref:Cytochrome c n=1 Tax=Jiella mangrovi TaxID=2821407 RepID=A0ABS4BF24_9HYPH|nr:cytochrome c [Jiella mangrovi]MBP0615358.1 cytochrome c [Jiella mangrovi]
MTALVSRATAALAVAALLCSTTPGQAADLAAGKKKASQCATCHGSDGLAVAPDAPNLAGDSAYYITEQLKAFRSGQRQHEQMSIIAKGLSDADIADLAAWYAAIEVTATLPKLD